MGWKGTYGCSGDVLQLKKNNQPICDKYGYGKCFIQYVGRFNVHDKIELYGICVHEYSESYNSIVIEKLPYN